MSIDDYRPHFMVEAVYDLKPDQLREHGIRAVLVAVSYTHLTLPTNSRV